MAASFEQQGPSVSRSPVLAPSMGVQFGLRFAQFVFSLIAFSVMASSRHEGANFNDFHAFSFLVAVTFLSGLWSFVLTVTTLVKIVFGNKEFTSKFYLAQYFLDAFFTLMVWGAACAGKSDLLLAKKEGPHFRSFAAM
ncbi:hypothetical protein KFL_000050080 [Klebsormidium nitens]|uniref:CASP-like protein n=1 Tax=Klebsormidium nitens TaxID=105231 RepID=A0A1Y1HLM1_KLENI|nr:hypothetical protein KFL_000050080 [Klebsormidium nitens]|eukprot:GAQ77871.1 hypothetical protein KFL_000050080 [Klebsormidium nitens]